MAYHDLAVFLDLASGLAQLTAASIGLATALLLRRRINDARRHEGRRDDPADSR